MMVTKKELKETLLTLGITVKIKVLPSDAAIANIINTISTGVLLRRKEFAMYKSVGLDNTGFKKMIRLETLLYSIKALIWGLTISLLLSYIMYSTFDMKLLTYDPDWLMYGVTMIAVFGILGISMALSISITSLKPLKKMRYNARFEK